MEPTDRPPRVATTRTVEEEAEKQPSASSPTANPWWRRFSIKFALALAMLLVYVAVPVPIIVITIDLLQDVIADKLATSVKILAASGAQYEVSQLQLVESSACALAHHHLFAKNDDEDISDNQLALIAMRVGSSVSMALSIRHRSGAVTALRSVPSAATAGGGGFVVARRYKVTAATLAAGATATTAAQRRQDDEVLTGTDTQFGFNMTTLESVTSSSYSDLRNPSGEALFKTLTASLLQTADTAPNGMLWNRSFAAMPASGTTRAQWDDELVPYTHSDGTQDLALRFVVVSYTSTLLEPVAMTTATVPLWALGQWSGSYLSLAGSQAFIFDHKKRVVGWTHGDAFTVRTRTLSGSGALNNNSNNFDEQEERYHHDSCINIDSTDSAETREACLFHPPHSLPVPHLAEFWPLLADAFVQSTKFNETLLLRFGRWTPSSRIASVFASVHPVRAGGPRDSTNQSQVFMILAIAPVDPILAGVTSRRTLVTALFFAVGAIFFLVAYLVLGTMTRSVEQLAERMQDPWGVELPSASPLRPSPTLSTSTVTTPSDTSFDVVVINSNNHNDSSNSDPHLSSGEASAVSSSSFFFGFVTLAEVFELEISFCEFRQLILNLRAFMAATDFAAINPNGMRRSLASIFLGSRRNSEQGNDAEDGQVSPNSASPRSSGLLQRKDSGDQQRQKQQQQEQKKEQPASVTEIENSASGNNLTSPTATNGGDQQQRRSSGGSNSKRKGVTFAVATDGQQQQQQSTVATNTNTTNSGDTPSASTQSVPSSSSSSVAPQAGKLVNVRNLGSSNNDNNRNDDRKSFSPLESLSPLALDKIFMLFVASVNFYNLHRSLDSPAELIERTQIIVTEMTALLRSTGATLVEYRGDRFTFCVRMRAGKQSNLVTRFVQQLMNVADTIGATRMAAAESAAGLNQVAPSAAAATTASNDMIVPPSQRRATMVRTGSMTFRRDAPIPRAETDSEHSLLALSASAPALDCVVPTTGTTSTSASTTTNMARINKNTYRGRYGAGPGRALVLSAGLSIGFARLVTMGGDDGVLSRSISFLGSCFAFAAGLERFVRRHPEITHHHDELSHLIAIEENQVGAMFGAVTMPVGERTDFIGKRLRMEARRRKNDNNNNNRPQNRGRSAAAAAARHDDDDDDDLATSVVRLLAVRAKPTLLTPIDNHSSF